MPTGLLFDCDAHVAKFLFEANNAPQFKYDRALGLIDAQGQLVGGVLFQNWNGYNVEMSYYGPNTMTLGVIRTLWRFAIYTFDPVRLTVSTSKRNRQFMRGLQKLGFRVEGAMRCFYGKRDCNRNTAIRFVMFRERMEQIAKIEPVETKGAAAC